jgi:hypothetical protein
MEAKKPLAAQWERERERERREGEKRLTAEGQAPCAATTGHGTLSATARQRPASGHRTLQC